MLKKISPEKVMLTIIMLMTWTVLVAIVAFFTLGLYALGIIKL